MLRMGTFNTSVAWRGAARNWGKQAGIHRAGQLSLTYTTNSWCLAAMQAKCCWDPEILLGRPEVHVPAL